jgi:hypothetical protein
MEGVEDVADTTPSKSIVDRTSPMRRKKLRVLLVCRIPDRLLTLHINSKTLAGLMV